MFSEFAQVSVEGVWWDLTDVTRRRQYCCVDKISSPGPREEIFLFALCRIVQDCGEVHRGGQNVPEVVVRIEDHLVPVDVVPGDVVVVVHLRDSHPWAGGADAVLSVPADVGAALH